MAEYKKVVQYEGVDYEIVITDNVQQHHSLEMGYPWTAKVSEKVLKHRGWFSTVTIWEEKFAMRCRDVNDLKGTFAMVLKRYLSHTQEVRESKELRAKKLAEFEAWNGVIDSEST